MSKIKRCQLFQLGAAVIMRGIPMPSSEKYVSEEERVKFVVRSARVWSGWSSSIQQAMSR